MGQRIKTFQDGSLLEYDKGNFDRWCVYYIAASGTRTAPKDADCFWWLKYLAEKHGTGKVYGDYVRIYDMVGKEAGGGDLNKISLLSAGYDRNALLADVLFSTLYLAMIAEERKQNTKLGKRIKRLGAHQLLLEGRSIRDAADFTRGKCWREIDGLCRERGF